MGVIARIQAVLYDGCFSLRKLPGHQSDIICRKRKGLLAASSKGTLFFHLLLFSFFPPTFGLCSAYAIEFCFT